MVVYEGSQGFLKLLLLPLSIARDNDDAILAPRLLHDAIADGEVEACAQASPARRLVPPQAVMQTF